MSDNHGARWPKTTTLVEHQQSPITGLTGKFVSSSEPLHRKIVLRETILAGYSGELGILI
jgi:hypothetical protein